MIKSRIINKYLAKEFLKVTFNITLVFFSLGIIMNVLEEINFLKDFDVNPYLPFTLSLLVVPNLTYHLFPFVILLAAMWLNLKIIKSDEIIAMKVSGFSNLSIIFVPSFLAFFLGLFFVTTVNPITSTLVEKYESIKGDYSEDKNYLASITNNGIWIKEQNDDVINIIRSSRLEGVNLINVSIYQFDKNNFPIGRIESKSANIENNLWLLKDVKIYKKDETYKLNESDQLTYKSIYNLDKIKTLYSNLDTISFWSLKNEIKLLYKRGYSTNEMRAKFQRSLAFPFFLLSMVLLAGVFTLTIKFKGSNWYYVLIGIVCCVLIYFFNDFSAALGKTDKLPIELSVWMPIIIIFTFSTVGLIHVNQK